MVTVLSNPAGASIIDQFDRVDEHLFFVHIGSARPDSTLAVTTPAMSDLKKEAEDGTKSAPSKKFRTTYLLRSGGNSLRADTKAKFFPIYVDEERQWIVGCGEQLPLGQSRDTAPKPPTGCTEVWPIKSDGTEACWQLSGPTFLRYLAEGRVALGKKRDDRYAMTYLTENDMAAIDSGELIVVGKDQNGAMLVEHASADTRKRDGKTIWTNTSYSAREHGGSFSSSGHTRPQIPVSQISLRRGRCPGVLCGL